MIFVLTISVGILSGDDFDSRAFFKKLAETRNAEKAHLLNQTANEIKFSSPQKARELAALALSWATRNKDLFEQAQAWTIQSMTLKIDQQFAKALELNQQALKLAESFGNRAQIAQIQSFMGLILSDLGELLPSIEYTRQAMDYYRLIGDEKRMAVMNNNLGARYYKMGVYDKSLYHHFASLEVDEKNASLLAAANNLNMIGINYLALEEAPKARTYLEKARDYYRKLEDHSGLARVLNNLGIAYKAEKNLTQALLSYRQANEMAGQSGNRVLQCETLINIGEIHRYRLEYQAALDSYHQARHVAETLSDFVSLATCCVNIGDVYLLMDKVNAADSWLGKGIAIAREKGYREVLAGGLENLKELHRKKGDYQRALDSLEELIRLRAEMMDAEKNRIIAETEGRYQLDKKERELILMRRDQEVHRLLLKSERQRLLIASMIGLMAFLGLFFLARRTRRLFVFWKKKNYIGHYQMGERIGGGGMSDVYKAYSLRDARLPVALKLMREEFARDSLMRQRFLQEARIVDQLDHPNIVKVLERGESNDRLFLAMEFIDGKTLAEIIRENPRLPVSFCIEMMMQLLDGVEALHRQGVLHRDLKPENVMVIGSISHKPRLKLLDFDLARDLRLTPLTQTGELLGTLPYMPPERVSDQLCTEKGDLYSLGVIFYEMLSGEKPFPADTPVEIMKQVLDQEAIAVKHFRGDLPEGINTLISALLSKDSACRPALGEIRSGLTV